MQPLPTLRALGVGDIVDESFRLLRANFVAFAGIAAVTEIPVGILLSVTRTGTAGLMPLGTPGTGRTGALDPSTLAPGVIVGSLLASVVVLLLTVLSVAALSVAISDSYLGRRVGIGSSYARALSRLGALLLSGLLAFILVSLLSGVLLIAWLLLAAVLTRAGAGAGGVLVEVVAGVAAICVFVRIVLGWVVVPQAIVLEGCGAGAAFRRSTKLVTGFRWKAAGVLVVSSLLLVVLQGVPSLLVSTLLQMLHADEGLVRLMSTLISIVSNTVLSPISLAASTLLFYDLKVRKEAFDLELLAGQISHASSALPL